MYDEFEKIKFFGKLLKKYKNGWKAVGYGHRESQTIRFKVLTQIADLNHKTVLDVGCGLGHLVSFFERNKIKVEYTGYDIIKKFIEKASKLYPEKRFEVKNIMEKIPDEKFDYVLACGVLNIPIGHNEEYIRELIKRMFSMCNEGVAINMLSSYADYYDPKCYYYSPEKILEWVLKKVSRWTVLRHDYLPHDFTLYIYKEPPDGEK